MDLPRDIAALPTVAEPDLSIAVCTFRRPELFDCLDSLGAQTGLEASLESGRVEVLVIDNDETDAQRYAVQRYADASPLPVRYVHAPARNISVARNAALDAARADWLLFIDDDEVARPDWAVRMLAARGDAHAVIGQVQAVYGDELPDWVARCDFHSTRLSGAVDNAYAGNALLDLAFIRAHELRFRLDLGLTGGEDTLFFKAFAARGGRIVYCADAVVFEPVPPGRASMSWIRRRRFRAGQTHGLVMRDFDPKAFRVLGVTAGAKAAVSAAMSVLTGPGTVRSRHWWARACLHAGAFRYRLRPTILEEYA